MRSQYITLQQRVAIAKNFCAKTANMKDWQVRNNHNRAMREIARELIRGKGYIIATEEEMNEKYGYPCDKKCQDKKKHIYSLCYNSIFNKIGFVSI